MKQDVVKRLMQLIRFRNEYPAFNGTFKAINSSTDSVILSWKKDDKECTLNINLKTNVSVIEYIKEDGKTASYLI